MLSKSWRAGALALAASCVFLCANADTQTPLLDEVHTIAAPTVAVPIEDTFNISNAGTYEITLTDLGAALTPAAPLASVQLAITSGSTVVGTPLSAAGSKSFSATPGAYVIHVIGTPGAVPGSGPVGITVTDASHNMIAGFSGTLALPSTAIPQDEAVLQGSFTVSTTGTYQVTLSDLSLPQPLGTLILALTIQGGALVTTLSAAGTMPVMLQGGVTYDVFAVGVSTATPPAGLFAVNVSPSGGGNALFSKVTPVGVVAPIASPALASGNYTFKLADLKFPSALTQVEALVTLDGQVVAGPLTATGSTPFAATANTYQVFALGVPSNSGTGAYSLILQPSSGPAALSVARAVSTPGSASTAYSYDGTVPTAGSYALTVADFTYPSPLLAVRAAAVQNGALVGSALTAVGSKNITAAAGPISFLVFVQPGTSGSLFGIDLAPAAGGSAAFATTQGVGELFSEYQLPITAAGNYGVTVSDLAFPAPLASLAVIVTQGTNHIGSIYTGGTFNFPATPGIYFINFVAQPGGAESAGTYALSVGLGPVVNLQSSAVAVPVGGTVTLTWSSQNSTGCTASGGWSGMQPVSGMATSPAITSATTFTLTCSGVGGSTAQSVKVAVAATPPSSGGGGGGTLDADVLSLLAGMSLLRLLSRTRRARA